MGACLGTGKQNKQTVEIIDNLADIGIAVAEANGVEVDDKIEDIIDDTLDVTRIMADVQIEQERKESVKQQASESIL